MRNVISKEQVEAILEYRPEKGDFLWKVSRGPARAGQVAGAIFSVNTPWPYWQIKINHKVYLAHRLVWLMEHGEMPSYIDHIDSNGLNNHISNLRKCDMSQNIANSRTSKKNTSGFKGVSWEKDSGKWLASIRYRRRKYRLGNFDSKEEAAAMYLAMAKDLFGEFARVG